MLTGCGRAAEKPLINVGVTDLTGGNVGEVKLEKGDKYAVITIRGFGDIKVKLLPECAPVAVKNFIDLADSGYYDEKKFHRVMSDFMIQGGSPTGDGSSDPNEDSFAVELAYNARHFYGALCMANAMGRNSQQFYIVNDKNPQEIYNPDDLRATLPTLADNIKNSEGAYKAYWQSVYDTRCGMVMFSENITDEIKEKYKSGGASFLDGGYTVFGQAVDGFDVIDAVSAVEVEFAENSADDKPSKPVDDVIIETVRIFTVE